MIFKFFQKSKCYGLWVACFVILAMLFFVISPAKADSGYEGNLLNTDNIEEPTKQEEDKTPMQRLENIGGKSGFAESEVPTDRAGEVLPVYLGGVVNAALSLLGVIFFALMVYGGFLWLYAGGNDEQVTKAKSIMIRALIGFIIVIFAGGITQFVLYSAGR